MPLNSAAQEVQLFALSLPPLSLYSQISVFIVSTGATIYLDGGGAPAQGSAARPPAASPTPGDAGISYYFTLPREGTERCLEPAKNEREAGSPFAIAMPSGGFQPANQLKRIVMYRVSVFTHGRTIGRVLLQVRSCGVRACAVCMQSDAPPLRECASSSSH